VRAEEGQSQTSGTVPLPWLSVVAGLQRVSPGIILVYLMWSFFFKEKHIGK